MDKERLIEQIINTDLVNVSEEKDIWEKQIYLDDNKVLIVGYEEEESFCEEYGDEECVITYQWYWELRDAETWDLIQQNHDTDITFCMERDKTLGGDMSSFEEIGDISGAVICTWSDQNQIEDIAEDIADEVLEWLKIG